MNSGSSLVSALGSNNWEKIKRDLFGFNQHLSSIFSKRLSSISAIGFWLHSDSPCFLINILYEHFSEYFVAGWRVIFH